MSDARLLLFTKPAVPGRVKTRLIDGPGDREPRGLSPQRAAALHQAFLDDLASRLSGGRFDLAVAWALGEGEVAPASEYAHVRQQGADLGERLYRALREAADSCPLVAAVGSDHPELPLSEVERGFSLLRDGADVVLGPAEDGGYYLIGARAESLSRRIFERIPWSTARVLSETRARCRQLGLRVALLDRGTDVDTPADLARLAERLSRDSRRKEPACPETVRLLTEWGWLGARAGRAAGRPPRDVATA